MIIAALAGHLLQHRPVFSTSKLKPDLSKLSPIAGFKRLFGLDGFVNLIKGVAKILLVGTAGILAGWAQRGPRGSAMGISGSGVGSLGVSIVRKVVVGALLLVGAG